MTNIPGKSSRGRVAPAAYYRIIGGFSEHPGQGGEVKEKGGKGNSGAGG